MNLCIDFKKYCDMENIENLRKDYSLAQLNEENVDKDPFKQFEKWFNQAIESQLLESNAMAIATCVNDKPSVRMVLLKGFNEKGFIFYTNYDSHKGKSLLNNHNVALTFFWSELQRQVRIEGRAEKISQEKSTEYFHSRPRGSQLGAVASPQSQIITREELENNYETLDKEHKNSEIPKPENWGGFLVVPETIEFWQGRRSRLHDRIFFRKENGFWHFVRLAP